jgi:hypothetical protein
MCPGTWNAFRTEGRQMPLEEIRDGYAKASEALLKLKEGL